MAENGATRIRLGMVGGGTGAFIGYVHRIASRLDGDYELVAGALSSNPRTAKASGRNLGLADDRIYTSYEEMAVRESERPDGIQAVSIVTPNHVHYGPAKAFLEAGIHVICDKPLTSTLEDARALLAIKPKKGAKFLLTHNYTGYPLVRQARELVKSGALGKIRVVQAEYAAGLADQPGLQQAGRLAHRSEALRRRRRHRRYRHPRLQFAALRHRAENRRRQCRPAKLRQGPQG